MNQHQPPVAGGDRALLDGAHEASRITAKGKKKHLYLSMSGSIGAVSSEDAMPHSVTPLPFKPPRLDGLPERLLASHYENNYGGALRRLNAIDKRLTERAIFRPRETLS